MADASGNIGFTAKSARLQGKKQTPQNESEPDFQPPVDWFPKITWRTWRLGSAKNAGFR
jgi:hypothetical protein